jgi:FkbM family methyltransferase
MANRKEINTDLLKLLQTRKVQTAPKGHPSLKLFKRINNFVFHKLKMNNRKKIINAIQRLSALTIVKYLHDFRGTFELISMSNLTMMILENSFELDVIPFFEKILRQGDQFIDCGANVGLYTNLSSKLVGQQGKVLAIEPNPFALKLLESNIRRNQLDNVILFNGVATSESGFYNLNATEGCPEYSSLGSIVHPHAPKEIRQVTVKGETVDNLVSAHNLNPILLKIDVEGAEGLVLSGATMVLEKYKPYILSELDDRLLKELSWDAMKVINLLEEFDYDVFNANNGAALSSNQLDSTFVGEIIALPKELNTLS